MWRHYTRHRFREGYAAQVGFTDSSHIQAGLREALEQVERMEYFQRAKGLLPALESSQSNDNSVGSSTGDTSAESSHSSNSNSSSSSSSGSDCTFIEASTSRSPQSSGDICMHGSGPSIDSTVVEFLETLRLERAVARSCK